MSQINDGGSAFPYIPRASSGNLDVTKQTPGMSLRDYFAAAVLQGMLTNQTTPKYLAKKSTDWKYLF